jgi:integrase
MRPAAPVVHPAATAPRSRARARAAGTEVGAAWHRRRPPRRASPARARIQQTVHRLADSGGAVTAQHPQGRPLSPKSVRHVGTLLHTCLSDGVRLGHLAVNPMADARVVLPKLPKRNPPVLDTGKIVLMYNRARGTRMFAFVVLASASGCRRSELLALTWADINLDAGLMIGKQIPRADQSGLAHQIDQERGAARNRSRR